MSLHDALSLLLPGALTMMAPMTAMAGALTFAWPHISTKGGFVAIAIFYG